MNMQLLVHIRLLCFVEKNEIIFFDIFGVKNVPKEIKEFVGHKSIKANVFRVEARNSIIRGYFSIGFIDFMFASKTLIDFTNLCSLYNFEKKL